MRLIDEHWIAYPQFIAGRLDFLERFKLDWLRRPVVRYLDVILSRAGPEGDAIMARVGLEPRDLCTRRAGRRDRTSGCRRCAAAFLAAANTLAGAGTPTVFIGPAGTAPSSRLRCFHALPQADLAD